jgi:hypothetical protein
MDNERLIQITSNYFCAGIVALNGRVIVTAPILKYMKGWDGMQVRNYCSHRGWSWTVSS